MAATGSSARSVETLAVASPAKQTATTSRAAKKSPAKKAPIEAAPKIEMKLDFLSGAQKINSPMNDDVWL